MTDYLMLRNAAGHYLRADIDLPTAPIAGDDCMWMRVDERLVSAVGEMALTIESQTDDRVTIAGSDYRELVLQKGPTRLPSAHVEELRETGFTVLERLLDTPSLERVKQETLRQIELQDPDADKTDGRLGVRDGLSWSADIARAVTHPAALWVMQEFLGTPDIHFCHPPGVTTMRPTKDLLGTFPEDGWHSDYPYHPGVFPQERWSDDSVFGVQFNICIDAFRADNAATQYVPQSHALRRWPPRAFNTGGTRVGQGTHRDVKQMEAPAGSALIYDARTWHRACDELNVSGEDRVAVLNAVAPSWVLPMTDKSRGTAVYRAAEVSDALNERERADIDRLCNAPTAAAPSWAPRLQARE